MHSALQCPLVGTSCMWGCHSARKTRSRLWRKTVGELSHIFMRMNYEACFGGVPLHLQWVMDAEENIQWTDFFRVPVSRHRWLPSEWTCFANLSSRRCHKNEDSKDLLPFEIWSVNIFLDSVLYFESSLSSLLHLGANNILFSQHLQTLSQHYFLIFLPEKHQKTYQLKVESDKIRVLAEIRNEGSSSYSASLLRTVLLVILQTPISFILTLFSSPQTQKDSLSFAKTHFALFQQRYQLVGGKAQGTFWVW